MRKINHPLFDHTDEGGTHNSVRLMGGNSTEIYGLAKSLSVMPGDTIHTEVYAKYLDTEPANWSAALHNAIAAIAGTASPGGTYVDGGAMGYTEGPFPYPDVLVRENDNGTGPKAYLNYLIFDRDMNPLDGGFRRITTAARETGQNADTINGIPHERLYFDDILIKQPGYVYIYLSNESETRAVPAEVLTGYYYSDPWFRKSFGGASEQVDIQELVTHVLNAQRGKNNFKLDQEQVDALKEVLSNPEATKERSKAEIEETRKGDGSETKSSTKR